MASNQQKISKLQQKLRQLDTIHHKFSPCGSSISQPKIEQTETLINMQIKYSSLQQRLNQIRNNEQKSLKLLQNQIYALNEQQKSFKRDFDKGIDRGDQEFHSVQRNIHSEFQEMVQEINHYKRSSIDSIDRKYKTVKAQSVSAINSEFQTQCKNSQIQIKDKLDKFKDKFVFSQSARDQAVEFMISSFGDEIIKLQSQIKQQKERRIQKNSQLIAAIKQIDFKMQNQVAKQRKQMLQKKCSMQEMLEDVCYKIQSKILGKMIHNVQYFQIFQSKINGGNYKIGKPIFSVFQAWKLG